MGEGLSNVEALDTSAVEAVMEARRAALSVTELESIKDEQDSVTLSFLRGEIGAAEFNRRIKDLDVEAGAIQREDMSEYAKVLRAAGFSEDEVRETISHEQAHMSSARSFGLRPFCQLQVARGASGFSFYPSINFDFPDSMPDEEQREILRRIIEAPEDQSPRDRDQLGV